MYQSNIKKVELLMHFFFGINGKYFKLFLAHYAIFVKKLIIKKRDKVSVLFSKTKLGSKTRYNPILHIVSTLADNKKTYFITLHHIY